MTWSHVVWLSLPRKCRKAIKYYQSQFFKHYCLNNIVTISFHFRLPKTLFLYYKIPKLTLTRQVSIFNPKQTLLSNWQRKTMITNYYTTQVLISFCFQVIQINRSYSVCIISTFAATMYKVTSDFCFLNINVLGTRILCFKPIFIRDFGLYN